MTAIKKQACSSPLHKRYMRALAKACPLLPSWPNLGQHWRHTLAKVWSILEAWYSYLHCVYLPPLPGHKCGPLPKLLGKGKCKVGNEDRVTL
eukprot:c12701_g1_i1 orf=3-275(-)